MERRELSTEVLAVLWSENRKGGFKVPSVAFDHIISSIIFKSVDDPVTGQADLDLLPVLDTLL